MSDLMLGKNNKPSSQKAFSTMFPLVFLMSLPGETYVSLAEEIKVPLHELERLLSAFMDVLSVKISQNFIYSQQNIASTLLHLWKCQLTGYTTLAFLFRSSHFMHSISQLSATLACRCFHCFWQENLRQLLTLHQIISYFTLLRRQDRAPLAENRK